MTAEVEVDPDTLDIEMWSKYMPSNHPTYGNDAYRQLEKSLAQGQEQPVHVWRGGVWDGRTRVMALRNLGKKCRVIFDPDNRFADEFDLQQAIIAVQLRRRNVSDRHHGELWRRLFALEQGRNPAITKQAFVAKAAEEAKQSPKAVAKAMKAAENAERVAPEVVEVVDKTCTEPDAVIEKLAVLPVEEQKQVIAQSTSAEKVSEREIKQNVESALRRNAEATIKLPSFQPPVEKTSPVAPSPPPTVEARKAPNIVVERTNSAFVQLVMALRQCHGEFPATVAMSEKLGQLHSEFRRICRD